MNAFRQSFDQEFKPHVSDIQRLGKEVKEAIDFAKTKADLDEHNLQRKERDAASKQRSMIGKLVPQAKRELETIKNLQLQQSERQSSQSSQHTHSVLKLTNLQEWKGSGFSNRCLHMITSPRSEKLAKSAKVVLPNGYFRLPNSLVGTMEPEHPCSGVPEKVHPPSRTFDT